MAAAAGAIRFIFGSPMTLACHRIEANANLMLIAQSYFRDINLCRITVDKGVQAMYRG